MAPTRRLEFYFPSALKEESIHVIVQASLLLVTSTESPIHFSMQYQIGLERGPSGEASDGLTASAKKARFQKQGNASFSL
jgi:hypothetical protein